jgi:hypothetical protein
VEAQLPFWHSVMLIPPVLLAGLPLWLVFVSESRVPLMGFTAYLPIGYQLLWCAIVVSAPLRLLLAVVLVLVAAVPTGMASWFVVSYGCQAFNWCQGVGGSIGLLLLTIPNALIVTAPLFVIERLLAGLDVDWWERAPLHWLGGLAVLPLTLAAMRLHLGVSSTGWAVPWLLALPTSVLIAAHFLLEVGMAVPHALLTLPRRIARAWLCVPLAAALAWGTPVLIAEIRGKSTVRYYHPVQNFVRFSNRIDQMRERLPR